MKSRLSTIRYEMTRDFIEYYTSDTIPEFTEDHATKLMEIFQIPNMQTCIVTGEKVAKGKGDHLFEVRGYLKKSGKVGIEQKWNMLPVSGTENTRYKKFKFTDKLGKKYTKNIGFEELTEEELAKCSDREKSLYQMIRRWFAYCESQNVKLGWEMPKSAEDEMEAAIDEAMQVLLMGIEKMKQSLD